MPLEVRAGALRKVYTSPPPIAGPGRGIGVPFGARRALAAFDTAFLLFGIHRFRRKAVT